MVSNKSQSVNESEESVNCIIVFSFKIVKFFNSIMDTVSHFLNVVLFKSTWSLGNVWRHTQS